MPASMPVLIRSSRIPLALVGAGIGPVTHPTPEDSNWGTITDALSLPFSQSASMGASWNIRQIPMHGTSSGFDAPIDAEVGKEHWMGDGPVMWNRVITDI